MSLFSHFQDLDFDPTPNYKLDFDWSASSRALPPVPHQPVTTMRRYNPSNNRQPHWVSEAKHMRWNNGPDRMPSSTITQFARNPTSYKATSQTYPNFEKLDHRDADEHSVMSVSSVDSAMTDTEKMKTGLLKEQQDILAALRSRSSYVRFFSPLKKRIEEHSKRVFASVRTDRSHGAVDTTVCTYNLALLVQDLTVIHQICGLLTTSSKDSPDAGLTRKFLLLRKTAEDVTARLGSIVREVESHSSPNSGELPRLLQLVSQTVESLDAAVLANAPLLFSPTKVLRRANSSHRPYMPDRTLETTRSLSSSVPQLNELDKAKVNAGLEELKRLDPQQFKTFQNGIQSLKQRCDTSTSLAHRFLKELQDHDWSPNSNKDPKSPLTPNFLTLQVKNTLHQSSLLVRAIAEFCSTVCGVGESLTLVDKNDCRRKIAVELENRGSAICEALKGLVIQAKEATSHLRSDGLDQMDSTKTVLPMPGPVWQRLLGSTRSVCMSLTAVNKILSSYVASATE
ncbi:unnamed protein product [Echinostoma caproni]|uniref:Vacuolar protein sorting-associated protein 54 n=1 Tax=Echinostoma caproni TaxID=27848 RepID=A0A183API5_9TREM|nr:unnamed protein product [Echinostoma caproni]